MEPAGVDWMQLRLLGYHWFSEVTTSPAFIPDTLMFFTHQRREGFIWRTQVRVSFKPAVVWSLWFVPFVFVYIVAAVLQLTLECLLTLFHQATGSSKPGRLQSCTLPRAVYLSADPHPQYWSESFSGMLMIKVTSSKCLVTVVKPNTDNFSWWACGSL